MATTTAIVWASEASKANGKRGTFFLFFFFADGAEKYRGKVTGLKKPQLCITMCRANPEFSRRFEGIAYILQHLA